MEIKRSIPGPRFNGIVEHNGVVYFAGLIGAGANIEEQTADILRKIDERLAMAGSDKDHLLQTTIFIKDMAYFDRMNAVWVAWINPAHASTRACVTSNMADPATLVEMVFIAAKK